MPKNLSKRLARANKRNRPLTSEKRRQLEQGADDEYYSKAATSQDPARYPSIREIVKKAAAYVRGHDRGVAERLDGKAPTESHRLFATDVLEQARKRGQTGPPRGVTRSGVLAYLTSEFPGVPQGRLEDAIISALQQERFRMCNPERDGFFWPESVYVATGANSGQEILTLRIAQDSRIAYCGGRRLNINCHVDFDVLDALNAADGGIVSYIDLLRTLKPSETSDAVRSIDEAPPEAKDAVSHIRRAFKEVNCHLTIDNIRGRGYRLMPTQAPDE